MTNKSHTIGMTLTLSLKETEVTVSSGIVEISELWLI